MNVNATAPRGGGRPGDTSFPSNRLVGWLRWLYVGLRWRIVSRLNRLQWAYRRKRSQAVGSGRKMMWLYRGLRWRVIGRLRKVMWFGRRRRRDARSGWRRVSWRARKLVRLVGQLTGAPLRSTSIAVGQGEVDRKKQREMHANRSRSFRLVADALELEPPARRLAIFNDWRLRNALFNRLSPIGTATRQVLTVSFPLAWERSELDAVGTARIVVAEVGADADGVLSGVVPILISGRPVCIVERDVDEWWTAPFVLDPLELVRLSDDELERCALEQLRVLVRSRLTLIGDSGRPRVAITLSTNRPEFVAAAVQRIAAQVDVSIELLVGCHGFDPAEVDSQVVAGGAIESARAIGFAEDVVFGDVLRELAEQATSVFVTKWDDDDLYGPHHVFDLWLFLLLSGSAMVGKAAEFVQLEERSLLVRRRGGPPYRQTTFLAGGTLMMWSDALAAVGSWASVPRSVDQNIISRFESAGLAPFRLHGYEFVLVRHGEGHTWAAASDYFERAADEIRAADAVTLMRSVGIGTVPDNAGAPKMPAGRSLITFCVPNQNNQGAVEIFERTLVERVGDVSLVICDDRSDPPLTASAEEGPVTLIRAPYGEGFGAGRARHAAAQAAAAGDGVLVFVDSDMYLESDVVERVRNRFEGGFVGVLHGELSFTSVAGPEALEIVRSDARDLAAHLGRHQIEGQLWRERHWAGSADYAHPRTSTYRGSVGAFVAIDKRSYLATGGFRDVPVRGVEDTEFGYRLMVAGCEQLLDRDGGIWHLGERTFADRLGPDEEAQRERHLAALVPVWTRSLSERRTTLGSWDGEVVPFVAVAHQALSDEIAKDLGDECVAVDGAATSVLDAPFAVAVGLEPSTAVRVISLAYDALRNRRCGEVEVWKDGEVVGRVIALWAMNLAERRIGRSDVHLGTPEPTRLLELAARMRADFDLAVIDLAD